MIRALKNRLRARRLRAWGWGRTWSRDELRTLKGDALTTADQREELRRQLAEGGPLPYQRGWPHAEFDLLEELRNRS